MTTPPPYDEILRAIADGKQVQRQDSDGNWADEDYSEVLVGISVCVYAAPRYRIKPEPKKAMYRVAEMRSQFDGRTYTYTADIDGDELQRSPNFVRWLTDWIEYEVSE